MISAQSTVDDRERDANWARVTRVQLVTTPAWEED